MTCSKFSELTENKTARSESYTKQTAAGNGFSTVQVAGGGTTPVTDYSHNSSNHRAIENPSGHTRRRRRNRARRNLVLRPLKSVPVLSVDRMYGIEHREVNNSRGRRPHEEPEDEDDEEENERGKEAWERTYADERSWESLQEDESGLLRPIDDKALHHAHYRREES
ncbi:hypothetical protein Droror1_Dr00020267 [Drosera rotundifolia]